jgi:DNA-binding NtrC family response regulator
LLKLAVDNNRIELTGYFMQHTILLIDDDETFLGSIKKILEMENYQTKCYSNPIEGLNDINVNDYDCVLTDVKMPGMNGLDLQKEICKIKPEIPVIALSGQSNISIAVEMLKNGAYDFLEKPIDDEKLLATLKNAIERRSMVEEKKNLFDELKENYKMIGHSSLFNEVIDKIKLISPTDARVLITGETGVGKELVAWALHHNSLRKTKPYIKLNCAAIPGELLESELFGHKRGSFTGADRDRVGKFAAADHGTLFLDEIGEMDFTLQAKLLRILEESEVEMIGENKPVKVDVRVITATNKNLKDQIKSGLFREDLFHRINVFELYIPPLRERKEDIIPLSQHLLSVFCNNYNKSISGFSPQVEGLLINQSWKGNVRELKNVVIFSAGKYITIEDYHRCVNSPNGSCYSSESNLSLKESKDKFEKELILETLSRNDWKVAATAEELGIERTNLFKKMQRHNIKKKF